MSARNNILITGANGFFGRLLVEYLIGQSLPVIAGTRSGVGQYSVPVEIVAHGTFPDVADLSETLDQVRVVVHCAARAHVLKDDAADPLSAFRASNTAATIELARQAVRHGVRRFIFLSSIAVNGNQTHGTPFTARDIPAPKSPYGVSKLEAEIALKELSRETGLEVVIVRPPLIIGPNPVGNMGTIAKLLSYGLPLPFGLATQNRRSLVSAKTLASLIEVCLVHHGAPGNVFLVADKIPMHTRAIIERVAEVTGQRARFLPIPIAPLRALIRLAGWRTTESQLFGDLEIDFSETTSCIGWQPGG